jgi:hypothetical protein
MWGARNLGLLCALGAGSASIFFVSSTWSPLLISCLCFFSVQILAIVLAEIAIQHVIPSEYQGWVFGISESLPYLALSLGSSTSGLLGEPAIAVLCVASFLIFFLCARTGNHRWELAKANA